MFISSRQVSSGTADWLGLQFWLCGCLTCESEQSCSLLEAPEVKHVDGLGPERASLTHSGEFAAKPYDAGKPPNYTSVPASGEWLVMSMGYEGERIHFVRVCR